MTTHVQLDDSALSLTTKCELEPAECSLEAYLHSWSGFAMLDDFTWLPDVVSHEGMIVEFLSRLTWSLSRP